MTEWSRIVAVVTSPPLLAAIVGLGGVWLTVRAAMNRMRLERAADARKAVFLEAVDSVTSLSRHLAALANIDADAVAISLSVDGGGIAKLQLVASDEVLMHAADAMRVYTAAMFELNMRRVNVLSRALSASPAELATLKIEHAEAGNQRVVAFGRATVPLVRSLRRELGVAPIEDEMFKRSLLFLDEIEAASAKFMAEMRGRIGPSSNSRTDDSR